MYTCFTGKSGWLLVIPFLLGCLCAAFLGMPVILFHARLGCPGGFVGVDIFFVISGFLITSLILHEMNDGSFSLAGFWERRIRRILPPLIPVVFATLVAGWFLYLPHDFELIGHSVAAQALLMSNFFFSRHTGYFDPGSDTMPLLHTWSLAVEEQFYVLLPLLLLFLARRKRLPIAGIILCLGIGLFELGVLGTDATQSANFYLLPTRAWELMIGAFLAAIPAKHLANPWLSETVAWCGLGLILYSIFFYTPATAFPGLAAIAPCLGAALIIFSGGGRPTLISRVLVLRPIVFIGLISYPLYLWHWPLLVFAKYVSMEAQSWRQRVALLMLSVLLAILSWEFVETPFRKRLWLPRRSQIFALAGCSMLLLLVLGGGVYLKQGMASRLPAQARNYLTQPFDETFWVRLNTAQIEAGEFVELGAQSTNQPVEILLWGDSHAMAVAPALDALCRKFSVRGVQVTQAAVAPTLGCVFHAKPRRNEDSNACSQSVADFVARKRVKSVVIAARWSVYDPPEQVGARLAATVQALMACGTHVYVLKDVPAAGFDVTRFVTLTALRHRDLEKLEISPAKYAADNFDYESTFNQLSRMGATVLDTPKYFLNSEGRYDVVRNDKLLYCDDNHLTFEGAKLLSPMFEPLFHNRSEGLAELTHLDRPR